jgi:phospholipid transport system substrate-binding protein
MKAVNQFVGYCLLALTISWSLPAYAEDAEPRLVVEKAATEVMAILEQEGDSIRNDSKEIARLANEHILPLFDFDKMSYFVLGKAWSDATEQQKSDFQKEFKEMLISTYASALSRFSTDGQIIYNDVMLSPKNANVAIVPTEIRQKGSGPIKVAYRMFRTDETWRIYDVLIDNVSLVTNYRASFASEVRADGLDGLIAKLGKHNQPRGQSGTANIQPASQAQ